MQLGGKVSRSTRAAAGAAPTQSAAIVRSSSGKASDVFLNMKPIQIGGRDPGFEDHDRTAGSLLKQVEFPAITDVDTSSEACVATPVATIADVLIENAQQDQTCRRRREKGNPIHKPPWKWTIDSGLKSFTPRFAFADPRSMMKSVDPLLPLTFTSTWLADQTPPS